MTLRDLLKGKLGRKELAAVPSSFDIIGSKEKAVAIIELPKSLKGKAEIIAEALMKKHKNVRSVLSKASPRSGIFRTRTMHLIAGESSTEVKHKESGCLFLLDPREVYFSPRESTERLRIASAVKKGEVVMVFFAGAGPFAILIAKKSKPAEVIAIEINPVAVDYFFRNNKLNKVDVNILLGDVMEKAQQFYGRCDRVVMPLPEKAFDYLEEAVKCSKKKGIIHMYFFSPEKEVNEWNKKVKRRIGQTGKKCRTSVSRVLPYGPRIWKYRMDIRLL
ncbi:MAG: class I SAM-dependent methyltransferase family protein [Candidatus Aenigmarchaeota archaeon]|nr:class I SAM-dependent methyltransferase family protein [Candidatus Aenigmarchaeota archaeon]